MSRLRFSCAQSARNEHPHPQQTPSLERERSCSTALQAKVRRRVVTYLSIPPPNTERIRAAPCITSKEVGRHACPSRILHLVYLARLTLLRLQRASDCAQTAQETAGSTQVPRWAKLFPALACSSRSRLRRPTRPFALGSRVPAFCALWRTFARRPKLCSSRGRWHLYLESTTE